MNHESSQVQLDGMLETIPMSPAQFAHFQAERTQHYAANLLRGDGGTAESAQARADAAFKKLLPALQDTPDHYFYMLRCPQRDLLVGHVWLSTLTTERGPTVFIYDLFIDAAYRRQGYGRRALLAVDTWAIKAGIRHIDLHVFGHNSAAQRLYQAHGYAATHIRMSRAL